MRDRLFKLYVLFVVLWDGISGAFQYWKTEIYDRELDERVCCDGRMCGCGGETIREQWTKQNKIIDEPPFYFPED